MTQVSYPHTWTRTHLDPDRSSSPTTRVCSLQSAKIASRSPTQQTIKLFLRRILLFVISRFDLLVTHGFKVSFVHSGMFLGVFSRFLHAPANVCICVHILCLCGIWHDVHFPLSPVWGHFCHVFIVTTLPPGLLFYGISFKDRSPTPHASAKLHIGRRKISDNCQLKKLEWEQESSATATAGIFYGGKRR